jgi:integrase/recombinase XerD
MDAITVIQSSDALAITEADPCLAALATWLEGKTPNTRRSYQAAVEDFFRHVGQHPREVTPLDVARWKEELKRRCTDATVAQRLSALSSYFAYLQKPQGEGQPLREHNPVDGVGRDDLEISPYERARKLSRDAFKRILEAVDDTTEAGARDKALFLFYVLCGRRRSEVVNLRGGDLRLDGQKVVYRVRLKGGRVKWKELPPPVWEAIRHYLDLAGRTLVRDAPVFTATVDAGDHLREYYGAPEPDGETPLTGEAVAQALKRYAAKAGLDPGAVTVHSLRHLGAELYQEASGDVRQTQMFLDHSHLDTTQIYLEQLTGEEHRHWQAMANKLGV